MQGRASRETYPPTHAGSLEVDCMIRRPFLHLVPIFALMLGASLPMPANASPLGRLHNRIFGDDDDDDKKKKKKKKDDDRDHDRDRHRDHDHSDHQDRSSSHRCYDHNHNGGCDECGRSLTIVRQRPIVEVRPTYERRTETYVVPRTYTERRYETYQVAPTRNSYQARSLEADVQIALRRNGYYNGPVDGDIGPGTRSSIRDYQYDRGLTPTGRIDTALLRSLGL